jgi:hypothetical protein
MDLRLGLIEPCLALEGKHMQLLPHSSRPRALRLLSDSRPWLLATRDHTLDA